MNEIAERIFWILDQVKLKEWQEHRLHHSIKLAELHLSLTYKLDLLMKAYLSSDKQILISPSLFKIENDVDMNFVIDEIRNFLDELKTDKDGWGGAVQGMIDEIHGLIEVFINAYNKE